MSTTPKDMVVRDGVAVFVAPGGVPFLFDHDKRQPNHCGTGEYVVRLMQDGLTEACHFDSPHEVLRTWTDSGIVADNARSDAQSLVII